MDELVPTNTDESEQAKGTRRWADYYAATRDRPPWPLLVRAAALRVGPGDALDLGAGAANEARYLLGLGYRVTAVDAEPAAVAALRALGEERLRAVQSSFAGFAFAADGYDLISAQLALPFNPLDSFGAMFARLVGALRPGALFAGDFFGVRDAWNTPGTALSFHTAAEVERLLRGLKLREWREVEEEVHLASGEPHHAHAFQIIAQRGTKA